VLAFAEYVHALVTDLSERWEDSADPWAAYTSSGRSPRDGESGHDHRREMLDENKWRAIRHGHDASFLARDGDGTVSLGEVVERECDRLGVSGIRDLYDSESGAARQRRLRDEQGPAALRESLVL